LGTEPEVIALLKGPLSALSQSADVSTLMAWLTLRAVERQSRRLEYLEGSRPGDDKPAAGPPAAAPDVPRAPAATKPGDPPPTGTAYAPAALDNEPVKSETAPPLPPPIEIGPAPGAQPRRPLPRPAGGIAPAPRRDRSTAPLPINPSAWPGGAPGSGLQR
jgi:large subunit ribosomal protein L24